MRGKVAKKLRKQAIKTAADSPFNTKKSMRYIYKQLKAAGHKLTHKHRGVFA